MKLQFRVLYREFLLRIVDLELIAPQGDITKLLGQFAALLITISFWVLLPSVALAGSASSPDFGLALTWFVAHFLISTTMLVVGLFAVLSWESMFPDRRDVLVLAPLPVRERTLFLAKVAAVATALSLTVLALNIFPGLLAPFVFAAEPAAPPVVYDPAMPPVTAANMQSVLDRDLIPAKTGAGSLAPETHAGITAGVLEHGDRRVFAYGTAATNSIFEIGSITKTFTGLVLARMAQEGKLRLDQPVRELLPPGTVAKPPAGEITLLDLATQHSGLPSMPDNFESADLATAASHYRAEDLYAYIGHRGVAKPDGAGFVYSNLGFGLLGQALANRAGITFPYLVQDEVTGPLGMRDTVVSLSSEKASRFIQGFTASHRPADRLNLTALAGAGALHSTAADLLVYLDAQLHPERFDTLSAALAQSQQVRADAGPDSRIALAWVYEANSGIYRHGGVTLGYSSYSFFNPAGDYAAIVLMNSAPGLINFADQLGIHIRQRLAGQPAISLANPVISGKGGLINWIRSFAAYWSTMLAAAAFVFCFMLSVQGLAQLLPRQWFLRLSAVLQMTFFVVLLTVYFLQPGFSSLESLAGNQRVLLWLPSYWFFGLFQELNGPTSPAFGFLTRRAWIGLALAACGAALAYLICYLRTLRKIAEQPDILPSAGGVHWLPQFGNTLTTGVVQFSIRTLLRSRQHRVILSFYLGLAVGLAIFIAKTPAVQEQASGSDPWHHVNAPMLAGSIVMMLAAVLGARLVFSMPLDLRANWIFRVTPVQGGRDCLAACRRSVLVLAVVPVWTVLAIVLLTMWPRWQAAGHLVVLWLLATILAELCLCGFHKIPFTCSYLPGKSYAHMAILSLGVLMVLLVWGIGLERGDLESPPGLAKMLVVLVAPAVFARWRTTKMAESPAGALQFEEELAPAILPLGLNRDGVWPAAIE